MTQQINLYSLAFRKPKKLFAANAMVLALAFLIVGLAAFYFYASLQVLQLERQARDLSAQVKAGLDRVGKLPPPDAGVADEKILDGRIAELESQLKSAGQTLAQATTPRGKQGYVEPLRAFARQRLEGVWLTSITLGGDSGELSFTGRALRAELVPQYIDRLTRDPGLKGRSFATLAIERETPPAAKAPADSAVPSAGVVFRLMASAPVEEK